MEEVRAVGEEARFWTWNVGFRLEQEVAIRERGGEVMLIALIVLARKHRTQSRMERGKLKEEELVKASAWPEGLSIAQGAANVVDVMTLGH